MASAEELRPDYLTKFALWFNDYATSRILTDVPVQPWRVFKYSAYAHFCLSMFGIVMGITCFCVGVQNSYLYGEVNCSDGADVFVPISNMVTAFIGLLALKQAHMVWNGFLHFIFCAIMILYNLLAVVDTILMAQRWHKWVKNPREDLPPDTPNWPESFLYFDWTLAAILIVNLILCLIMTVIHLVYHRDVCGWQRQQARARRRSLYTQHIDATLNQV